MPFPFPSNVFGTLLPFCLTLPIFPDIPIKRRTTVSRLKYSQCFLLPLRALNYISSSRRAIVSLWFLLSVLCCFETQIIFAFLQELYIFTPMTDRLDTSVTETYERRLNSKPQVFSATFVRSTLGASGIANKFFLALLFSNPEVAVHFLEDVGLFRSGMVWCNCWSEMSWCIDTNLRTVTVGDVGGSHLLPHYLFPRQSGTIHGFSRVTSISQRFSPSRTSFAHTNTI